jgi:hypothetical protein
MKKNILLFLMLLPFIGFSQNEIIKSYPFNGDQEGWDNSANATVSYDTDAGALATGSLKYVTIANKQAKSPSITTSAGDYILSFKVKPSATGNDATAKIKGVLYTSDSSGNEPGTATTITGLTSTTGADGGTWYAYSHTFTDLSSPSHNIWIQANKAGTYYIDDVTFEKVVVGCAGSTITTSIGAAGGGTAAITSPDSDDCYANGTDVEVTAVACGGFAFSKWEIDVNGVATESTDNPLTYSVTATPNAVVEIKAIFLASAAVPDTNFDTTAELSNWAVNGNSTAVVAANNLTWTISGDTPRLIYNVCSFAPETWGTSHLKIGYTNQTSNTRLRFAIPKVGGSAFINFDGMAIAGDGTSGVGEIDALIRNDNWTGSISQLEFIIKLNSINGAADQGDFVIDYIEFYNGFETTGNGVWNTAATWVGNDVPTVLDNVQINHNISIGTTTGAVVNNLDVDADAALTIASGGSLIVSGTSTGNVTYNTTLGTENWYFVSSPVFGETYDNAYVIANSLAINGTINAIGSYATADNTWSYMQTDAGATFTPGTGYSVRRATSAGSGDISFTGTMNTSDVAASVITGDTNSFNLIGNPFTAYLNSASFLTGNTGSLDTQTIWVWNQASGIYETKVTADAFVLAPTQGFFVNASSATNLNIAESYQANTGSAFQKTTKTEVKLIMNDGTNDRFAKLYYLDNATTGFDNGYDGKLFSGVAQPFAIYTHLVADSEGKKYQVQSLPNSDLESMVIPIGVIANAGKEITFSAEALNLPDGIKVFLEDRLANTFNELSDNKTFKVNLSEALNDVGRFYLHTSSNALSIDDSVILENVSIYKTNASTLKIVGLPNGIANIKLINVLGKQLMNTSFNANGAKEISLPNLAAGIYIVQLETEFSKLNKKIVLE